MNRMGLVRNQPQTKYYKKNRTRVLQKIKIRNDKRKEEKTFQCIECDKTYTDNRNLQKHLNGTRHAKRIARKDKNYLLAYDCVVCEYSTKYKQNYNTHLKSKKHARNSIPAKKEEVSEELKAP